MLVDGGEWRTKSNEDRHLTAAQDNTAFIVYGKLFQSCGTQWSWWKLAMCDRASVA